MSFSQDIRATGNFQRQFQKEKRRLQISEVPKSDIDTLQEHVVDIRTQIHFTDAADNKENVKDIQLGPNDYYFEPDYSTVKIRTLFRDIAGKGVYAKRTLNAKDYDTLELRNQAATGDVFRYAIPSKTNQEYIDTPTLFWNWNVGFHPSNLVHGNSIPLNIGSNTNQFLYFDIAGTNFDFNTNNISLGFWIYITALPTSGNKAVVAYRYQDVSNQWTIEIDGTDNKLFTIVKDTAVQTKRQYDTALSLNTWYFVALSWTESGATLVTKVNNLADTTSTKTTGTTATTNNLFFGSYPGAATTQDLHGYITGITYYKTTALNSTELTALYTYNTKSAITEPFIWGYGQYG